MTTTESREAADEVGAARTELSASVAGPVLGPADPDYAAEVATFDVQLDYRPRLAVGATSEADVAATLRIASRHRLSVAVVGTTHSGVGPADADILLTTRRLAGVSVDPVRATATVGPGATWGDVLAAATPLGLAPLCGSAPGVGVVGLLLGGGIGPIARTMGYSADHVRSFRLVTVDGTVHQVDAQQRRDLFRALRGGKGGFGIVTSVTIELPPAPVLYGGGLFFDAADAERVLHGYCDWLAGGVPDELSTSIALIQFPPLPQVPEPLRGRYIVHLRIAHVGDPAGDGHTAAEAAVQPLRALATPVLDTVAALPYAAIGSIHADPTDPMIIASGGLLLASFDHAAADAVLAVAGPRATAPLSIVEIRHLGGALSHPPRTPDSVGGRDAAFGVWVVSAPLPAPDPDTLTAFTSVVRGVLDTFGPWGTGGTQINFFGPANTAVEFDATWPADTADRLRALRLAVDPDGLLPFGPSRTARVTA
ncbi:MAG TPA: FAD-binding oxidoreductase [Pseudonocardia sp.]|jgi:FAD/FMN-containing dehydrogenase